MGERIQIEKNERGLYGKTPGNDLIRGTDDMPIHLYHLGLRKVIPILTLILFLYIFLP